MSSKRCHHCGFVNFADAEVCKRCGEKLLTVRQAKYREQMRAEQAPPEAKNSFAPSKMFIGIITGVLCLIVILAVINQISRKTPIAKPATTPLAQPSPSAYDEAVAKRQQFARGLQSMTHEGGILRNIAVSTEDADDKTLVLTADNMVEDDCRTIEASTYMRAAELAGFDLLVCRDRSGNEWKKRLIPQR
jgi:ribosomal protein L40E